MRGKTAPATQTPDASAVYECCVAYAVDVDGVPRSVRHGEKLRGNDPRFLAAPQFFCEQGAPHSERVTMLDFIKDTGVQTTPARRRPDGWLRGRDSADAWDD
jgi:hypothetical protein